MLWKTDHHIHIITLTTGKNQSKNVTFLKLCGAALWCYAGLPLNIFLQSLNRNGQTKTALTRLHISCKRRWIVFEIYSLKIKFCSTDQLRSVLNVTKCTLNNFCRNIYKCNDTFLIIWGGPFGGGGLSWGDHWPLNIFLQILNRKVQHNTGINGLRIICNSGCKWYEGEVFETYICFKNVIITAILYTRIKKVKNCAHIFNWECSKCQETHSI